MRAMYDNLAVGDCAALRVVEGLRFRPLGFRAVYRGHCAVAWVFLLLSERKMRESVAQLRCEGGFEVDGATSKWLTAAKCGGTES